MKRCWDSRLLGTHFIDSESPAFILVVVGCSSFTCAHILLFFMSFLCICNRKRSRGGRQGRKRKHQKQYRRQPERIKKYLSSVAGTKQFTCIAYTVVENN